MVLGLFASLQRDKQTKEIKKQLDETARLLLTIASWTVTPKFWEQIWSHLSFKIFALSAKLILFSKAREGFTQWSFYRALKKGSPDLAGLPKFSDDFSELKSKKFF